jgi:tetratricopeptide (TPR) repeat protein
VRTASAETWSRAGETILLSLVFLAPLAVHGRTYDPAALKTALFESCALALAAAWVLKGLARGRWAAAAASRPALAPLLALAAWTLARFAFAPFKGAALPDLALTLSAWIVYAVALLEFGGARSAARLAFWTAAAAALVGAFGASQLLARGPGLAATLTSPDQLAAFAAVALPVVLSLSLDPESSAARRLLSASTAVVLALLAAWSGSARGLAAFALSSVFFGLVAAFFLRGPASRRVAFAAAGCALFAAVDFAVSGSFAPVPGIPGVFAGAGLIGGGLLAWAMLAAVFGGLRAAWDLRARGALAEAGYSAAFASAFGAWALASALGLTPRHGAGAWLAWSAGAIAAGMVPLARPRGVVLTMPLPFGEDVRRLMQGPVLGLFVCLAAWPAGWLASDVRYNRAVAEARAGSLDAAFADAGRAWPGSPVYAPAIYLRGRVLQDQGKPGEALEEFARLDEVSPDFSRVHARRAEAYAAVGDWGSSMIERERQAGLTPLDLPNLTAWAEAARTAGDMKEARRAAERAVAVAPGDESVRLQVAANALLEKRIAERGSPSRGRKGTAFRPRLKPR